MPSKWRVTAYVPENIYKALEAWAASENRSLSNLAGTVLVKALEEYEQQQKLK